MARREDCGSPIGAKAKNAAVKGDVVQSSSGVARPKCCPNAHHSFSESSRWGLTPRRPRTASLNSSRCLSRRGLFSRDPTRRSIRVFGAFAQSTRSRVDRSCQLAFRCPRQMYVRAWSSSEFRNSWKFPRSKLDLLKPILDRRFRPRKLG